MAYTVAPGLSLDTKVYRYMELAKFLSLIHQHHLFFCQSQFIRRPPRRHAHGPG